jgi:hypothetical protein
MAPAEFSGTILYCGRRLHPRHGWIEVLGYQNTVVNRAPGPNAMLLHLPAWSMSPDQFVPASRADRVLHDMVDAVRPVSRGLARGGPASMGAAGPFVHVFRHDIYTVVLADNPAMIPDALDRVEPRRRPARNQALFDFYAEMFPGYPVALCCFSNADAAEAKPLLLWYRPRDPDRVVAPALDCHSGAVPDLGAAVHANHWVLFGSDHADPDWGAPVTYGQRPRHGLVEFLPPRVLGAHVSGLLPNGDFALQHQDLLRGELHLLERVKPAAA